MRANARRPHLRGYNRTKIARDCGTRIRCLKCGYVGPADRIESAVFGSGVLERCAVCRSLNFVHEESVMEWLQDEWTGCYPSQWKGMIVPKAMSHPAKFSSRLIRRIYEHMREEGWVKEGNTILDPFGGVSLGALDAMRMGLRWRGVELEAKFVELGTQNINQWNNRFSGMPNWCGDAVLLQGDSRKLVEVLSAFSDQPSAVSGTVSSPPYKNEVDGGGLNVNKPATFRGVLKHGSLSMGESDGNLANMDSDGFEASISSPPFEQRSADGGWQMFGKYAEQGKLTVKQVRGDPNKSYPSWDKERDTSYGVSEGQLGKMDSGGFKAAVSSPPFRQSDGGTPEPKPGGTIDGGLYARHAAGNGKAEGYGGSDGQLANMDDPQGSFQGAVSSPPYAESQLTYNKNGLIHDGKHYERPYMEGMSNENYGGADGQLGAMDGEGFDAAVSSPPYEGSMKGSNVDPEEAARRKTANSMVGGTWMTEGRKQSYATMMSGYNPDNPDNLGTSEGENFWMAARQIVEQVYQALQPGGHAVWVCKDFVKNKERVSFSDQWRQLCEAVGFVTVHEHHAMLVHGKQYKLEGGVKVAESKSFFRRLAEKKGSPRIDYETVWCMMKAPSPALPQMEEHNLGKGAK